MGSVVFRNRYWWYRSLYDDYNGRQMRMAFSLAGIIWLGHYWFGIRYNRAIEENATHKNYFLVYGPRRIRLAHSLMLEEFQMQLQNWKQLNEQYTSKGKSMLQESNANKQ